jgi:hypothetical protein
LYLDGEIFNWFIFHKHKELCGNRNFFSFFSPIVLCVYVEKRNFSSPPEKKTWIRFPLLLFLGLQLNLIEMMMMIQHCWMTSDKHSRHFAFFSSFSFHRFCHTARIDSRFSLFIFFYLLFIYLMFLFSSIVWIIELNFECFTRLPESWIFGRHFWFISISYSLSLSPPHNNKPAIYLIQWKFSVKFVCIQYS